MMHFETSTRFKTTLSPRHRQSLVRDVGSPADGPDHDVDIYALTDEQRMAAEHIFHLLSNRAADMNALRDESNSEPVDRSNWVWVKPRELRRYELLNEYNPQLDILLDHDSFTQLYSACLAAFEAWAEDPQDYVRFETWLTLNRLVHLCADPMHRSTLDLLQDDRVGRKNRRIRWPRWLFGNSAVSRSSVPQDGQVNGQPTSGVSPLTGANSVSRVNSG